MYKTFQSRERRRGSVLILYAVLLPLVILITGLAVDVTMMYIVQAQLQTAVDGAARGALRLLGTGANTTEIAGEFLRANIPTGYWWTSSLTPTNISVTTNSTAHTINVSAKVDLPLYFMHYLGKRTATVTAGSSATGWELTPCTLNYPYGSPPALSSVSFGESITMVGYGPSFVQPRGTIMAWYSD